MVVRERQWQNSREGRMVAGTKEEERKGDLFQIMEIRIVRFSVGLEEGKNLKQGSIAFFCKGPDSKYFQLCRLYCFCYNQSAVLLCVRAAMDSI